MDRNRKFKRLSGLLATALLLFLLNSASRANPACKVISFEDQQPEGFTQTEVWCGIGIDHKGGVYLGITDMVLRDVAVVRYNSNTGAKELLGTLKGISAADSNLGPNPYWEEEETFSKIHSPILEFENKMYFSSHDFFQRPRSVAELKSHRGGHFYCYDLETGKFSDLSKTDSGGVSVPHQSIITMNIMPEQRKLLGWTYPYGDVLAYDLATGKTVCHQGPAGYRTLNGGVSRVIMSASNEKVYFSYGKPQTYLWELDLNTGEMNSVTYTGLLNTGMFNGLCKTRSGDTLYLKDSRGDLYLFAPATRTFQRLGSLVPQHEIWSGKTLKQSSGLILSKDETRLYTLPYGISGTVSYNLYEYNLLTRQKRNLGSFLNSLYGRVITGSGVVDDSGRIYFASYDPYVKGKTAIVQINPGSLPAIDDRDLQIPSVAYSASPVVRWNPISGQAEIRFPESYGGAPAFIQIVDVSGRLIRNLRHERGPLAVWDGRNRRGASVKAGIYFVRVRIEGREFLSRVSNVR